jgi:preprotein translocase subunit SecE
MKSRNAVAKRSAPAKRASRRFGFFTDTVAELKKVTWLTWQDGVRLTIMVLIVTIAMGLILGVVDFGFSKLVNGVFVGG